MLNHPFVGYQTIFFPLSDSPSNKISPKALPKSPNLVSLTWSPDSYPKSLESPQEDLKFPWTTKNIHSKRISQDVLSRNGCPLPSPPNGSSATETAFLASTAAFPGGGAGNGIWLRSNGAAEAFFRCGTVFWKGNGGWKMVEICWNKGDFSWFVCGFWVDVASCFFFTNQRWRWMRILTCSNGDVIFMIMGHIWVKNGA